MSLITRVSLTAFSGQKILLLRQEAALLADYFMKEGQKQKSPNMLSASKQKMAVSANMSLNWGASPSVFGQMQMLAPMLVGRHAEERQGIYDDLKREARQFDHMGHGPHMGLAGARLKLSTARNCLPMLARLSWR